MLQRHIRKLITLGMILAISVFFTVTTDFFFTWNNISNMLRSASYVGIIASGLTITIIGAGNDLSTGATVGFIGVLASRLLDFGIPVLPSILICCLAGMLCGLINGFLIVKFRLPDFIATLATMNAYTGLIYLFAFRKNGAIMTQSVKNKAFLALGGDVAGIYYSVIVWAVVSIVIHILLSKTKFGIYTYALGTDMKAAQLTGINTKKIKCIGYVICGLCSAISGIMLLAYQGGSALSTGTSYTFDAICAVVIGGIALSGGNGDIIGAVLGCIFMQALKNGLYKIGIASEWQTVAVGGMIIVMSIVNTFIIRRSRKSLENERYNS